MSEVKKVEIKAGQIWKADISGNIKIYVISVGEQRAFCRCLNTNYESTYEFRYILSMWSLCK